MLPRLLCVGVSFHLTLFTEIKKKKKDSLFSASIRHWLYMNRISPHPCHLHSSFLSESCLKVHSTCYALKHVNTKKIFSFLFLSLLFLPSMDASVICRDQPCSQCILSINGLSLAKHSLVSHCFSPHSIAQYMLAVQ